jgi:hypothetical protein
MWLKISILAPISLIVLIWGAVIFGEVSWEGKTTALHAQMQASRIPIATTSYDATAIDSLPEPVKRYFQAVLRDGQKIISSARFSHTGEFRIKESEDRWIPFTSTQTTITHPAGFVWVARMRMAPGVNALVYDAYVAGEGLLHAEALGLITVADIRGTPAASQGELSRYFAETAWYPTALLPSQGVEWEGIDDSSAMARFTDKETTVLLTFHFDSANLISGVKAEARYHGDLNGIPEYLPWEGRFWDYEFRSGMQIPMQGEVSWQLAEGLLPYWRGRVIEIDYEFTQ